MLRLLHEAVGDCDRTANRRVHESINGWCWHRTDVPRTKGRRRGMSPSREETDNETS